MHEKKLSQLLSDYSIPDLEKRDVSLAGISIDTRTLKPGELFLAYPGIQSDGRNYIHDAILNGAAAILYEPLNCPELPSSIDIPFIAFPHLREQSGLLAARWFDFPTRHLTVYGVTGTNGKTSCSHYIAQCLTTLQKPCAVLGTIGAGFPAQLMPSTLTTPDAFTVQQFAAEMLAQGAQSLAMEVSSHGLVQGRVNGVQFNTAIFTNLTHDHLDFHGSMAAYGAAKAQLFHWPSLQQAIINIDDPFGYELFKSLQSQTGLSVIGCTQHAYSSETGLIVHAEQITANQEGLHARVTTPWGIGELHCRLLGRFNLDNVLAVLAALVGNGIPLEQALAAIQKLKAVPGRMQCLGGGHKPLVVVDYAHTPDALTQVLQTLRSYNPKRLWAVFGCGGDRDVTKRPEMGHAAQAYADYLMVTNDNPRTENPEKIVADIRKGISAEGRVEVEYDRAQAIMHTIRAAKAGDIILIAGKGHEDYQIIGKQKTHFSDVEWAEKALEGYEHAL